MTYPNDLYHKQLSSSQFQESEASSYIQIPNKVLHLFIESIQV